MTAQQGTVRDMAQTSGAAGGNRAGQTGRRGILMAAGAVAALAAKSVVDSTPVAADGATWTMPYDSGQVSATTPLAGFHNTGTNAGVSGSAASYHGVTGTTAAPANSHFAGVYGSGNGVGTYGVLGYALPDGIGVGGNTTTGVGVLGASAGTGSGVSATNAGTGFGVFATANNNHSIYGDLLSTAPGTAGVHGRGNGAGTYGVYGLNNGGAGVYGFGQGNIGVYGVSDGGASPFGVVGAVTSAPGFALFGVANVSGTVGFAAGAGVSGAIAGQFSGPVNIYNNGAVAPGNLFIQGNYTAGGTKSAAVPHPDGSHRLLYCVESPEAWFEDFGTGTLTGGKADVKLDADFAAVVDTSKLHVFLTPHDTTHHLAVTARAGGGFSVGAGVAGDATARGVKATDVNGTFTYRVVAKRKDVAAPRLAKFDLPREIKAPALVIPPAPSASGSTKPPKS